jgi:hypothetical protein
VLTVRIALDLDPGSEPVAGRLVAGGIAREFTGYAGLIAALEGLRQAPPPPVLDLEEDRPSPPAR